MKGQHTLVLTSESVKEALEDYVNRHLIEKAGVRLIYWTAENAHDPVNKSVTVKFRPKGEADPVAGDFGLPSPQKDNT